MYIFKRFSGFTLIELMITVAIIGILAGIAYPSYTEYVTKGKRSDAKAALLQVQLLEEKFRANNPAYGTLGDIGAGATSPDGYYNLTDVGTPDGSSYAVSATPVATDSTCGTFAVNQDGPDHSGSYANADCWGK